MRKADGQRVSTNSRFELKRRDYESGELVFANKVQQDAQMTIIESSDM